MGKWMFTFTVFWAYIGFSQYMLIWSANMPETQYFLVRNTESWWALEHAFRGRAVLRSLRTLLMGFKKRPRRLCLLAAWILSMQLLDMR